MIIAKKQIKADKYTLLGILIFIMVAAKLMQLFLLTGKYNNDANYMMRFLEGAYGKDQDYTFYYASFFFKPGYALLKIDTVKKWAIVLSIFGNAYIIRLVSKEIKFRDLFVFSFLCIYVALLNIFVFMPMKEFVQFVIFDFLQRIIQKKRMKTNRKVLVILLAALAEGFIFRPYYLLIGALFVGLYIINSHTGILEYKKVIKTLIIAFIAAVGMLFCLKAVYPAGYSIIANIRFQQIEFRIGNEDAQSLIVDVLPNNNPVTLTVNVFLNLLRILLPVELLIKGNPLYLLFFIAQLYLLVMLFKFRKMAISEKKAGSATLVYIYLVSYMIVSSIYEPDFGSVIRHVAALFPLLCIGLPQKMHSSKIHSSISLVYNGLGDESIKS